jgi:hypothetical protein
MSSSNMSLLPLATLHSDSEQEHIEKNQELLQRKKPLASLNFVKWPNILK